MKSLPKSVYDNLNFLTVEVDSQLARLQQFFDQPTSAAARRILDRLGYTTNLKARIHSSSVQALSKGKKNNSARLNLRMAEFIATDLERITELCCNSVKHLDYISELALLKPASYIAMLETLRHEIRKIHKTLTSNNSQLAITIGQVEEQIQQSRQKLKKYYTEQLKQKNHTEVFIQGLFLTHEFKQMGESLRQISESIISANLGQPINFERFFSLQSLISELPSEDGEFNIEPIAETRSGSSISGITSSHKEENGFVAIFKDGQKRKVKEEKQGVQSWHDIYPGLAPKILSYKKRGESAALLIEHLSGYTFEQILLTESPELLQEAQQQLSNTLKSVWQATRTNKPVCANFIAQLEKRMPDVYKIHPEFQRQNAVIGEFALPSFELLMAQAKTLESTVSCPFSVYIHGDFNLDNIIYDPLEKKINFIDLHRSSHMDYVQDVSVFMVSNYRLQILDKHTRQKIMAVAQTFYKMARRYAVRENDSLFDLRLALGLARSFATSTRFILDKSLANRMYLRAQYLLQLVLSLPPEKHSKFKIPLKELFVE
ncbi:phosphotransferase [Paraglaciecola aquimarina]|uniref:Phosphotransferase n=1 Tax=Paraglaciecola aquimarina TaxID=1235557 RepID=A0ABU3T0R2_9ALTE|nr:phosphotransferase [Paraglaciecola aquimarina]MDU0355843.1 phosphotransferase [Paraglaciecola aquimarina]